VAYYECIIDTDEMAVQGIRPTPRRLSSMPDSLIISVGPFRNICCRPNQAAGIPRAIPSPDSTLTTTGEALIPNIMAINHSSMSGKNNVRCNSEGSHFMMYPWTFDKLNLLDPLPPIVSGCLWASKNGKLSNFSKRQILIPLPFSRQPAGGPPSPSAARCSIDRDDPGQTK